MKTIKAKGKRNIENLQETDVSQMNITQSILKEKLFYFLQNERLTSTI